MYSLLLAIIYLAFISLGLPDALLGSAWPLMFGELGVNVSYAGIISMIISAGTILSSLFSDKLTRKLGTGLVTSISVFLTAAALFGFSRANSFLLLCLLAVPYGLGAGAVDAGLNNYVALHYKSRHMSWLHCFWGVGASIGPYIMGCAISAGRGWRSGYGIVALIQIALTVFLFLSLPLWKGRKTDASGSEAYEADIGISGALKIRGVKPILLAFFGYCAFESTAGLWASTYLSQYRGVDEQTAAAFASLFYLGITAGRFFGGFIADRAGDKRMIRIGAFLMIGSALLIGLPTGTNLTALVGLVAAGIGASPVYPAVIHATPQNFGKENSHAIVGIQMASAYLGTTFMPPLFGLLAENVSLSLYPFYLTLLAAGMFFMTEVVNKTVKNRC